MKWLTLSALTLFIFGIFTVPATVSAAVVRSNSEVEISSEETISENLYIASGRTTINGNVDGDLSVASGDVLLRGIVKDDVIIFGGDIEITGSVSGDLRIVGGDVRVSGHVDGDLLIVGGQVNILPDASVDGDILLVGGKILVEGPINTNLRAIGGNIELKGEIGGGANITTQRLDLESGTKITGTLNYFSPQEFRKGDNVEILGKINFNQISSLKENGIIQQAVVSFLNFWMLLKFVTTLLLTFILVYIFKVFSQRTIEDTFKSFLPSFVTGILVAIFMPVAIAVFFVSLILIPISILLILSYIFILILSTAISGIAIGALVKKAFSKSENFEVTFNTAVIGVVIITLLQFVPYLGEITRILFFMAAFGAIWRYIYRQIRWGNLPLFGNKK